MGPLPAVRSCPAHVAFVALTTLFALAGCATHAGVDRAFADEYFADEVTSWVRPDGTSESFRYRLMRPDPLPLSGTLPLVVFLHGAGERGDDNTSQLLHFPERFADGDLRARYRCYLLAVQCRAGNRWSEVDWSAEQSQPMTPEPTLDLARVEHAVRTVLAQEAVDPDRIYLTGLSMGGFGAFDLAARRGDLFAAVVPICGGGDPVMAPLVAHLPFWVWHGEDDPIVPVARSQAMVDALRRAGGEPRWSRLDGVGHAAWERAYDQEEGVLAWLFAQRRTR